MVDCRFVMMAGHSLPRLLPRLGRQRSAPRQDLPVLLTEDPEVRERPREHREFREQRPGSLRPRFARTWSAFDVSPDWDPAGRRRDATRLDISAHLRVEERVERVEEHLRVGRVEELRVERRNGNLVPARSREPPAPPPPAASALPQRAPTIPLEIMQRLCTLQTVQAPSYLGGLSSLSEKENVAPTMALGVSPKLFENPTLPLGVIQNSYTTLPTAQAPSFPGYPQPSFPGCSQPSFPCPRSSLVQNPYTQPAPSPWADARRSLPSPWTMTPTGTATGAGVAGTVAPTAFASGKNNALQQAPIHNNHNNALQQAPIHNNALQQAPIPPIRLGGAAPVGLGGAPAAQLGQLGGAPFSLVGGAPAAQLSSAGWNNCVAPGSAPLGGAPAVQLGQLGSAGWNACSAPPGSTSAPPARLDGASSAVLRPRSPEALSQQPAQRMPPAALQATCHRTTSQQTLGFDFAGLGF